MTDQHQRPSDEVTVGVIRAWKDWNSIRVYRRHENEVYYECDDTPQGTPSLYDPRDDTGAALDLLFAVMEESDCLRKVGGKWAIDAPMFYPECAGWQEPGDYIPVSGQPFRYAVVHLAAKVLGVE